MAKRLRTIGTITLVQAGDHIYVRRTTGYTHHGVYMGDETVVHFSGEPANKRGALVRRDPLEFFECGGVVRVREYDSRLPVDEVLRRAEQSVGTTGYNLLVNNCEHFATWCVTGKATCAQVRTATSTGAVGGTTTIGAAGGIGVVAAVGEAGGLSGAGIMSGLAAVGVGGAVGGLASLGALNGAASVVVMQVALKDDERLPQAERTARGVGRKASAAGAVAGTGAGVAAVSAAGTVSGLSAAGITSGLAAIGGVVGGGMAAGTVIVVAAPAVAAAGVGYGSYRAVRTWKRARAKRAGCVVELPEIPKESTKPAIDSATIRRALGRG